MSNKILVVDDDCGIVEVVKGLLETEGFIVNAAYDGEEALEKINESKPDLIILDWTMPRLNGWEVCHKLRMDKEACQLPIIMLTARRNPEDEIISLDVGVDDFITKPFNSDVLLARVKALLRRCIQEDISEISSGEICINSDKHTVLVEGNIIQLWPKEFDLLYFLMRKIGSAVSREVLLESVWGYEYFGTTRTVDATIKRLREKLGTQSKRIETIKGIGYKFTEE